MTTISQAQRWKILKLWTEYCRQRGWKASDRDLRLSTMGGWINRPLASLDELGKMEECTVVLNQLAALVHDDLKAALKADDASINQAESYRTVIREEILPCLANYEADPVAYMVSVMTDKNRWWKLDAPIRAMALKDLTAAQAKQLLMTLNARLHAKRRAARHSIHDMKLLAGVTCHCATICSRRAATAAAPAVAAPAMAAPVMEFGPETEDEHEVVGDNNPF